MRETLVTPRWDGVGTRFGTSTGVVVGRRNGSGVPFLPGKQWPWTTKSSEWTGGVRRIVIQIRHLHLQQGFSLKPLVLTGSTILSRSPHSSPCPLNTLFCEVSLTFWAPLWTGGHPRLYQSYTVSCTQRTLLVTTRPVSTVEWVTTLSRCSFPTR